MWKLLLYQLEWRPQAVLKLIGLFKNEECLYNTKNPLYHNKHARTDALESIVEKMSDMLLSLTSTDVKTKLNYLRSQYGRELLRVSESTKSGIGTDELYVPSAYWYDHLHFIKDFVRVRRGKSNIVHIDSKSSFTETEDLTPAKQKKKVFGIR